MITNENGVWKYVVLCPHPSVSQPNSNCNTEHNFTLDAFKKLPVDSHGGTIYRVVNCKTCHKDIYDPATPEDVARLLEAAEKNKKATV